MVEPYWKVTADLFSKTIEKPKMTEKHLSRPPPKYIFDIIVNTMKATGFPKGLYTDEELDPKFFDADKEHRIDFLQKAVDITKIVLNMKLEAKVKNMLAGEEAEKTNIFLQNFYKAATSGKDFPKYIKKYLDHISKNKTDKPKEEAAKPAEKPKKEEPKKEEPKKEEPKAKPAEEKPKKPRPETPKEKKEIKKPVEKESDKAAQKPTENKNEDNNDNTDLGMDTGKKIKMDRLGGAKKKGQLGGDAPAHRPTINLKDIEMIKTYIQDISKNANPINKLLEYLPEDVYSMNKELNHWKSESTKYDELYEEELKKSEEKLFPLEKEYLELEETIRDETLRIKSIKTRILTNEHIVQNLINGVISVKNI